MKKVPKETFVEKCLHNIGKSCETSLKIWARMLKIESCRQNWRTNISFSRAPVGAKKNNGHLLLKQLPPKFGVIFRKLFKVPVTLLLDSLNHPLTLQSLLSVRFLSVSQFWELVSQLRYLGSQILDRVILLIDGVFQIFELICLVINDVLKIVNRIFSLLPERSWISFNIT